MRATAAAAAHRQRRFAQRVVGALRRRKCCINVAAGCHRYATAHRKNASCSETTHAITSTHSSISAKSVHRRGDEYVDRSGFTAKRQVAHEFESSDARGCGVEMPQ